MPRYYCDYCDTYLTHDSPSVRKQHNAGYKHKANVRSYYQQFEEQQTQSLIDQRIKEHLGQAAAFQQVGATFNQRLPIIPRLPILPPPVLPLGTPQPLMTTPLVPGVRPPLLPRPISAYPGAPPVPASAAPPSGAASMPMPIGGLPGPPPMNPPPSGPLIPSSSSSAPAYYQVDPSVGLMATAAPSSAAAPQDGSSHSLPSDSNP